MTLNKQDFIGITSIFAALVVSLNVSVTLNSNYTPIEHFSSAAASLAAMAIIGLLVGLVAQKFFSQQLLVSAGVATLAITLVSASGQSSRPMPPQSFEQCVLQEMKNQPAMTTVLGYAIKVCKEKTGTQ